MWLASSPRVLCGSRRAPVPACTQSARGNIKQHASSRRHPAAHLPRPGRPGVSRAAAEGGGAGEPGGGGGGEGGEAAGGRARGAVATAEGSAGGRAAPRHGYCGCPGI